MLIPMPDLTVEVYNSVYRVLSQIPWQEAIRLILRGAVYIIDLHSPKALVAQWIAHRFPGPGVAGSSPAKGAHATPQASVAQRIECQSTKLVMGVRFSPGVLAFAISLRSSTDRAPVS